MTLSRRQFLRRTGGFAALLAKPTLSASSGEVPINASVFGTSLGICNALSPLGRAFNNTSILHKPAQDARVVGQALADSLNPLLGVSSDGWYYHTKDGYIAREALQPILPYERPHIDLEYAKGYHETIAPVTAIRQYCAGHAKVVGRVAYGAVLYVHDHLIDDKRQTWYAVSVGHNGAGMFGWVPALHLRRWVPGTSTLANPALWIDTTTCKISVFDGETLVGETAFYGPTILRGVGFVRVNLPSAWANVPPALVRSWLMVFQQNGQKPLPIYGAFWHNRFGLPGAQKAIDLPMPAARWLYNMLGGVSQPEIPVVVE